jgi:hypothetical protein
MLLTMFTTGRGLATCPAFTHVEERAEGRGAVKEVLMREGKAARYWGSWSTEYAAKER